MTDVPHRAFAMAVGLLYPEALQPTATAAAANAQGRLVHPTAEIAEEVTLEPGAIVGWEARIGAGTTIAAGAVVGYRVFVGQNCYVGPGATVTHALIGDRVILHPGALNKLARTFTSQVETLKRYRTGGEQKVTVQHVSVNDNAQAIVGDVSTGGRRNRKNRQGGDG